MHPHTPPGRQSWREEGWPELIHMNLGQLNKRTQTPHIGYTNSGVLPKIRIQGFSNVNYLHFHHSDLTGPFHLEIPFKTKVTPRDGQTDQESTNLFCLIFDAA